MPDLGRFFNVDPLSEEYTYNSSYAFSENVLINAIELEGLEKIIAIFYHGGAFGDGSIRPNTEGTGGAGVIYNETAQHAQNQGIEFIGAIIAPAATQGPGVRTGQDFLKDNYKDGDQVIVYGYSYGGDNAVNLTERAENDGIPVSTLIIVDSTDGPMRGTTVDTSVPNSVETAYNFFQNKASGDSLASESNPDGDNPDISENSSADGSSNSPGSRGYPHSSEGTADVRNINVHGEEITHGNLQTKAKALIMSAIIDEISIFFK